MLMVGLVKAFALYMIYIATVTCTCKLLNLKTQFYLTQLAFRLPGGVSLFSLMGVGPLDKKKRKQKNQNAPNSLNARTVGCNKVHLTSVSAL
jgi:hypothetical protein